MSHIDRVDCDLMEYNKRQARTDAKFEEFKVKADEIVGDMVFHLGQLKSDYEEYVSYDDLDDYVRDSVIEEFNIRR
ncbi:hypothetical protein [Campylobacter sp. RM16190]|uniref:hypothetical protein n=1 Tax=Campylobacter sp. RM16190 TaxID=1705727 RepID=UPI001473B0DD|nr:hypothetical protein [Campylobacter sp. RM16190]